MLEWHVLFIMDLMIRKTFYFDFCCIVCIFFGICAIFYMRMSSAQKKQPAKPFFQKCTCGGKRASTHVGARHPTLMLWLHLICANISKSVMPFNAEATFTDCTRAQQCLKII